MKKLLVLIIAGCWLVAACADRDSVRPVLDQNGNLNGVIYGADSVRDLKDNQTAGSLGFKNNSLASAALIDIQELKQNSDRSWTLNDKTVEERYRTCPEFKMSQQTSAAFCSSVLIAPDKVLTAAHCLSQENEHDCGSTALVFGFDQTLDQNVKKVLSARQVYRCRQVIEAGDIAKGGLDYAVIQLDRPVEGVMPITFQAELGSVFLRQNVYTVGYPVGTSKKAAQGRIRQLDSGTKNPRASLDIYYGNSGGPVFDSQTDQLVGIVMNGEDDFVETQDRCQMPKRCNDDQCAGEEILPLRKISKTTKILFTDSK